MRIFTKILCLFVLVSFFISSNFTLSAQNRVAAPSSAPAAVNINLNVYPNPTKGLTNFTFTTASSSQQVSALNMKIRISNTIGKVVKVIDAKDFKDTQGVSVDLSELSAGIYFYSLILNDKTVETKRLIIQP